MAIYKTPGVYIEEKSVLPPSVATVSTAIPAFIGYTEKAEKEGQSLVNKPTRITTLLEYQTLFGGAKAAEWTVNIKGNEIIKVNDPSPAKYLMAYSIDMYFKNGGGPCYIVSVGGYTDSNSIDKKKLSDGLNALLKEDEPTLLVQVDVVNLSSSDQGTLYKSALQQCVKLQDRFCIFDVLREDQGAVNFRKDIGINDLKYGAAYYPFIKSTLNYHYNDDTVSLVEEGTTAEKKGGKIPSVSLKSIKDAQTGLYNQVKTQLAKFRVILPPSAAVAGVNAKTDSDRGVWKAPANSSLNAVIEPDVKITVDDQDQLNVDPTAGKSINAIRSFTGKGTLIWGARTLAGNDNEWRYINVRRLFIFIEESVQKSTAFAVFEPNHAMTWLKIRVMVGSFLESLWKEGALVGNSQAEAFFVKVGLGESMTEQDVLEGRIIVEIGIAAVRPAEFIIMQFSHKLQGS